MTKHIAIAALLAATACTHLPVDGWSDDVSRSSRDTYAPPPRPDRAAAVLGAFGGREVEPAFPDATRPVIVRRSPEGETVWTADNVTGDCCNEMTIDQYSERYRGQ